ncbi:MAG: Ig-like domain-containing protein [Actinomycetota bacterium]
MTYTPNSGATGTDSFTFKANDGTADSNIATISITIEDDGGGGGEIAFRAASSGANTVATTLVIPTPSGVVPGDVLIASVDIAGTPTTTAPAGWTLIRTDTRGTRLRKLSYFHVAGASEPSSYRWTFNAARAAGGGIAAYSGVDTSDPIDASGGKANAASTSITAPSITTTVPDALLVGLFGMRGKRTVTPPTVMSERWDVASTTGTPKVTSEAADEAQPSAGATGTRIATASNTGVNIGQLIALRPAGP